MAYYAIENMQVIVTKVPYSAMDMSRRLLEDSISMEGILVNLSIVLTDFMDIEGILKTYRFIPTNQYNKVVVDRLGDICADVKGNTDKDIGLLRIYNSDKCQLLSTKCKINNFSYNLGQISFGFEHMYIPVESSNYGSCGFYNFILPIGYRLTELHIVDPFDKKNRDIKEKKHFKYDVFYDSEKKLQVVQMQLRSNRGSFSFYLTGRADMKNDNADFIDYKNQNIYLDDDLREFFFDEEIKKSFWKHLKESVILEPSFNGIGIDLKKLFRK